MTEPRDSRIREVIQHAIEEVPIGQTFDSHFVIQRIIEIDSDAYLRFSARFTESEQLTLTMHQQIGQLIAGFEGQLVERLSYQSNSRNIRNNYSGCALWLRI